jgi:hypothetical protein
MKGYTHNRGRFRAIWLAGRQEVPLHDPLRVVGELLRGKFVKPFRMHLLTQLSDVVGNLVTFPSLENFLH